MPLLSLLVDMGGQFVLRQVLRAGVVFLGRCRVLVEELSFQKQPEGVGQICLVDTVVF